MPFVFQERSRISHRLWAIGESQGSGCLWSLPGSGELAVVYTESQLSLLVLAKMGAISEDALSSLPIVLTVASFFPIISLFSIENLSVFYFPLAPNQIPDMLP